MADDLTLQFGAQTTDVDKGVASIRSRLDELQGQTDKMASRFQAAGDAISASMSKAADSMKELEDGFTKAFEVLKKGSLSEGTLLKLLFGGAIGGAAAEIIKSVRSMGDEFDEMEKHAREATLTIEQYSALQKAVKDDVNATQFSAGIEAAATKWNDLNHGVTETSKLLDENNIRYKKQGELIISFNDYIAISSKLIQNARTEVDKFKIGEQLGFTREWTRALQQGPIELKKATEEAAKTSEEHLKLIKRAHEFSEQWKAATQDWGDKFKAIMVELFPYIEQFVNKMLEGLNAWVTILGQARTPDLVEAISTAEHASNRLRNSMQSVKEQFDSAVGSTNKFRDTFEAVETHSSTLEKQFRSVVDQMSPLPKIWQEAYNFIAASDAAITKLGEEDFFSKSGTKIPGQFDTAGLRQLQEEMDKVREKYQQQKVIEQTAVDTFKETETQKVAHLKAALAERAAATEAIFAKEIALAGNSAEKRAEAERRASKERNAIQLEGLKLEEDIQKKTVQEWEEVGKSITGAFNSQLRGLLAGTTTWAQAMKNIAADLVIKIIEKFEELALVQPFAAMMKDIPPPTELFASLTKIITGMFGTLEAGFTAFFAPTMGPAAPAAGAAAAGGELATALAATKFETGTDYVPRTGLALVHQGERIIPASQNAVGGSGVPAVNIAFNISAMDSNDVQKFFKRYGGQIAKQLNSYTTMNPSFS